MRLNFIDRILFVAVVYNNYEVTLTYCESLAQLHVQIPLSVACYLVDNSDDQIIRSQLDCLKIKYPFVKVLRPKSNLGYFGAFNFFLSNITKPVNTAVVLCNNDLIVDSQFCKELVTHTAPDDVLVLCPSVVTATGVDQNPHVLQPYGWVQRFKLDLYFSHYYLACLLKIVYDPFRAYFRRSRIRSASRAGYLHMGIGACYVLLPNFFNHFDKLYYPYFLYGEEAFLAKQVHDVGMRSYYEPKLKVYHHESATLSKLPRRVTYEYAKAGYWEYRKYY
jgi:GT2 family glycosyltransferase